LLKGLFYDSTLLGTDGVLLWKINIPLPANCVPFIWRKAP